MRSFFSLLQFETGTTDNNFMAMFNKELIKYIADLVNDKRIEGISNVNDESDRNGMRIVVDVKRDANSGVVLNKSHFNDCTCLNIR